MIPKIKSFKDFVSHKISETISYSGGENIIVGDSLTPLIAKHIKKAGPISKTQGPASLWQGGKALKWLKDAVDAYQQSPNIKNVVISIGSNGGFNEREDVKGLAVSLKRKFPNANLIVIKGSWGWGGNRSVTTDKVERYYKKFAEEGINVVPTAVGYSATDREAHSDRPVLATIGKEVDSLILSGGKPSGSAVSTGTAATTASAVTSTSSTQGGVISRPGDPYRYKVVNDHWLAKRDDQAKWYEITGADFKPPFQKSIDILDQENPSLRTERAPKKSGTAASSSASTNNGNSSTSGEENGSIISVGPGVDPKKQDPKISKEFNFHLIPDGKGTNYRSAQFTENVMKDIYRKYNIKNVIRFNGNNKDAKHLSSHPETSISAEERICKDLGINFHKISSSREKHHKKVIELLSQGNTLIHCAHGADRTGGNVGGYLYKTKANPAISTTEQIWKYTTQYNGWNNMCINNPRGFEKGGYLKQAQKFGVKDLADAQRLARLN